MNQPNRRTFLNSASMGWGLCIQLVLTAGSALAQEQKPADKDAKPAEKVTYQDHVLPIFRAKCGTCHGADQAKGGLVVDSYTSLMQGGASGEVVAGGDVDGSHLWNLINHKEQPAMPPKEPKLPDETLALIRKWIEGGALENVNSKAKIKKAAVALGTAVISTGKPEGPPPMPEALPTDPLVLSTRGNAVTALATSPWAPLAAVAGHKQILLYNTQELRLIGVLPFPEGVAQVLKFSRNGSLLLAGGGRSGQSGRVIVWDVRSGKRVFEIGSEYDSVLAADISADHSQIALGGPKKIVRVFSTKDGELMYELKKHTDWITVLEFSPDGVLLATGDRSNGLMCWEAYTGREFFSFTGHTGAITGIDWRPDSNLFASSSEDGTIKLWEINNGTLVKNWGAHGGGAAAVQFTRDSRLVSTGRDRVTKLWDQNGQQLRAFPALNDLGLEVAFSSEDERVLAGDWTGVVRVWNAKDGAELPSLALNPAPLAVRLDAAAKAVIATDAVAAQTAAQVVALKKVAADKQAAADAAVKQAADGQTAAAAAQAEKTAADKALVDAAAAATAAETAANNAKAAVDKLVAEKAVAEKAVADAGEGAKADAEKALAEKLAALKAAEEALVAAKAQHEKQVTAKGTAEKAVNDLAAKVKATADQAVALKAAADKAVEAAKPTPETTKALADAEAASKAAVDQAAAAKTLVEKLTAEKGRTFEPVGAGPQAAAN
jgi:hypothetical protein